MNVLQLMQQQDAMPETYKQLSVEEMEQRVARVKRELGTRLFIPGHHYQKMKSSNLQMRQVIHCSLHK